MAPGSSDTPLEPFIELSSALTGFDIAELWATGMAENYFGVVPSILGGDYLGRLLTRWASIQGRAGSDERYRDELIASELLADATLGPLAKNVVALWYLGMWNQLPASWRTENGAFARDVTAYVSARAYQQALVWKAAHTHPPGAKQQGFGSWALPPDEVHRR